MSIEAEASVRVDKKRAERLEAFSPPTHAIEPSLLLNSRTEAVEETNFLFEIAYRLLEVSIGSEMEASTEPFQFSKFLLPPLDIRADPLLQGSFLDACHSSSLAIFWPF